MKIVYVTRHFNRSGYAILQSLINHSIEIDTIVFHDQLTRWNSKWFRPFLMAIYRLKCFYYRCRPLKAVESEYFLAKKNNIPYHLSPSIKSNETYQYLLEKKPDLIVLGGGWHELIPPRVIQVPKVGCINTHPSLLPEFRGTSITRWQVFHGINKSGVTIHYVNEKFDDGEILAQDSIDLNSEVTPQELFQQLSDLGAKMMVDLLRQFSAGTQQIIEPVTTGEHQAYFKRWVWSEENLAINWGNSFDKIHYHILSNTQESYEYPGPSFTINGKSYILRRTALHPISEYKISENQSSKMMVLKRTKNSIFLYRKSENYVLELSQVQPYENYPRKRAIPVAMVLTEKEGDLFNV